MELSIVITSFNTKDLLSDCLRSITETLKNASFQWEIIVVDNGSTDGTVAMLRKHDDRLVVINNSNNEGFGKGNNQGIRKAKGTFILLLNSDTIILPHAIEQLYAFTKDHDNAFVGPKLLNADRTPQTSAGPFFTIPVVFAALFLKGDVIGLTRWSPSKTRNVDWVSGAAIMAKKTVFLDGLLFDEGIFMYMEEVDLLYRARQKGYHTIFFADASVIHLGCGGSQEKRKNAILNIYRGFLYLYKKHYKHNIAVLSFMLKLKARLGQYAGKLTGNTRMKQTYEEAYHLV